MGAEWKRIEHPDELLELNAEEIVRRLKPVMRNAGLIGQRVSLSTSARHVENALEVIWRLGLKWTEDPTVDGGKREVGFAEYYAMRWRAEALAVDRKGNPHMYDKHGRYLPNREKVNLDQPRTGEREDSEKLTLAGLVADPESIDNAPESWRDTLRTRTKHQVGWAPPHDDGRPIHERLLDAMNAARVEIPSQVALCLALDGRAAGSIQTPRQTGKALGQENYKARPATQVDIQILNLVADGWQVGEWRKRPEFRVFLKVEKIL